MKSETLELFQLYVIVLIKLPKPDSPWFFQALSLYLGELDAWFYHCWARIHNPSPSNSTGCTCRPASIHWIMHKYPSIHNRALLCAGSWEGCPILRSPCSHALLVFLLPFSVSVLTPIDITCKCWCYPVSSSLDFNISIDLTYSHVVASIAIYMWMNPTLNV